MGSSVRTVLLVHDDAAMRYYLGMLLMRLQYVVLTATTPEEAIKSAEQTTPFVVLTMAPRLNGTDLLRTLKASARTSAVPVIVLADEDNAEVRSSFRSMGYAACLVNPVAPHELYRAIQAETETMPRAHIRLNLSLKAVMGSEGALGGGEPAAYTSTISEGGCYLRTNSPQPKNTLTLLKIFIKDREVRIKAQVLRHDRHGRTASREGGMGMKFIEIPDSDRIFLRNFITEQLTYDMPGGFRSGSS